MITLPSLPIPQTGYFSPTYLLPIYIPVQAPASPIQITTQLALMAVAFPGHTSIVESQLPIISTAASTATIAASTFASQRIQSEREIVLSKEVISPSLSLTTASSSNSDSLSTSSTSIRKNHSSSESVKETDDSKKKEPEEEMSESELYPDSSSSESKKWTWAQTIFLANLFNKSTKKNWLEESATKHFPTLKATEISRYFSSVIKKTLKNGRIYPLRCHKDAAPCSSFAMNMERVNKYYSSFTGKEKVSEQLSWPQEKQLVTCFNESQRAQWIKKSLKKFPGKTGRFLSAYFRKLRNPKNGRIDATGLITPAPNQRDNFPGDSIQLDITKFNAKKGLKKTSRKKIALHSNLSNKSTNSLSSSSSSHVAISLSSTSELLETKKKRLPQTSLVSTESATKKQKS